jgi:hypothetical protein
MSNKRTAKVMGQEAFQQAFVEAEIIMRKALEKRLLDRAAKETDLGVQRGLKIGAKIVMGETE